MFLSTEELLEDLAKTAYEDYGFIGSVEYIGEVKKHILLLENTPATNKLLRFEFWLAVEKRVFHLARRDGFFNTGVV